jgi:Flp pilus assembly protein TadD
MIKSQKKGARLGLAMLGAGMLLSAAPAHAQTGVPGSDGPGEALSRNLRSLAENPKSIFALTGAGKAALELGDPQAAITFFGRAEEQAPRDGRIKMWIGASLVQMQQAQGALKFFAEATGLGVPEAEVAGPRGLAYDLLGEPRRAQRDYRLSLASRPSAEVSRQLALSLAISGEREPALRILEDQLLIRDKAAERAKAFVLALTGDAAGATRAVQASMPAQSAALTPFLQRLPALTLTERAQAVHFGLFPSRARNLPVPPPTVYASVDPKVTTRATAPSARQGTRGSRASADPRSQNRARPVQQAAAAPVQIEPKLKAEEPRRVASSSGNSNSAWAWSRGVPEPRPNRTKETPAASARQQVASLAPRVEIRRPEPQTATLAPPVDTGLAEQRVALAPPVSMPSTTIQQPARPVVTAAAEPRPQVPGFTTETSAQARRDEVSQPSATSAPVQLAEASPSVIAPGFSISAAPEPISPPQQPVSELASVEAPPPAAAPVEEKGASRLAGIASLIASLPDAAPSAEPVPVEPAKKPAPAPVKTPAPVAKKEVAIAKKEVPAKAAPKKDVVPEKKPVSPAEPKRIWVQVAGGADKAALPREYTRLKGKAPKLLAARAAWTTPLKTTNRLLVGPFKTDGEAQAFVNELKKAELTGFAWTSEAGQKIEKLSAK